MPAPLRPHDFVQYVDAFLATAKRLVGTDQPPVWRPGRDDGCLRVKYPIEIDGELRGESLIVDAFPDRTPIDYHVLIEVGPAVCRVDFEPHGTHTNEIFGPIGGLSPIVNGPHYHSWPINKHFFVSTVSAIKLQNAVPLASNLRQFDAVFRWFASENNIRLDGQIDIALPPRTRIL
jgi:hypothetical protein